VGGGGLIAGIAAYVKYLRPEIKVIGVEPDDSNCLQAAMAAGERVVLPTVGIFADGVAVAQIGQHTFDICKDYVDEVITVSTDEICAAIKDIYDDTRSITEPAGALGVAGIKKYVERAASPGRPWWPSTPAPTSTSTACATWPSAPSWARARSDHRRDHPRAGQLQGVLRGHRQAPDHRIQLPLHTGSEAHIFVGVQTHPENDPRSALRQLTEQGFPVLDLTDNELAKLHIRHMVGGHAARSAMKWCCASSSRSGRGAVQLPQQAGRALEHLDVPLPQPRRSRWPRGRRPASAGGRAPSGAGGAGGNRLSVLGRK
jgi:threonine dehydratase